jgi:hypothetical protein
MLVHTYILKWNFKIEPFVVQYVVQKEKDMHMKKLEIGHKLFWGVIEMEKTPMSTQIKAFGGKGFWCCFYQKPHSYNKSHKAHLPR